MKHAIKIVLAASLAASASAVAAQPAAPDPAPLMAPVAQFIAATNRMDEQATAKAFTAAPMILDDVAPHRFSGTGAVHDWFASLKRTFARDGLTDGKMEIGAPGDVAMEPNAAYLSVPATFSFKMHGKPMHAGGRFSFTFAKVAAGWKISGLAWAGENAQ